MCGEICILLHNDLFCGVHAGIGGLVLLQRGYICAGESLSVRKDKLVSEKIRLGW